MDFYFSSYYIHDFYYSPAITYNRTFSGWFFGFQKLPAVFGAAEAGDQFILCFLLSIVKRYTQAPTKATNVQPRSRKSGCCFIALINLTVILCGNINKHVQIGSTYFSAFLKGADRFHYYFQPTSVSSLTFLVVPCHKYIALLLILGSTWRSN